MGVLLRKRLVATPLLLHWQPWQRPHERKSKR